MDLSIPIDTALPEYKTFLSDLQGNILKGHGRDHTVNCFLRFDGCPARIGAALAALVEDDLITSAAAQIAGTAALKDGGRRDVPVAFLFITQSGYEKLGRAAVATPDQPFTDGMVNRTNLGDRHSEWEHRLKHGIDAMLLAACDAPWDEDNSTKYAEAGAVAHADMLMARLAPAGIVEQAREIGRARKNGDGEGIEHFGYVDGRSQPLLTKAEVDKEPKLKGPDFTWNPAFSPLDTVLVPDPNGAHGPDSFGSYFVFRKLEQNVWGFKKSEQDLADALGLTGDDREKAGAMVVGRFEDGTPFVLDQNEAGPPVRNDFTYADDPDGAICPFHAHIRKTNPRGDSVRELGQTDAKERGHIMARRGITYGDRTDDPDDPDIARKPETGNGLLFMSYQRSLTDQFEFTQQAWANNGSFVAGPGTGIDPVIGQDPGAATPFEYQWPNPSGSKGHISCAFPQHVKMLGGAYFFAPSLSAIRSFAKIAETADEGEPVAAK